MGGLGLVSRLGDSCFRRPTGCCGVTRTSFEPWPGLHVGARIASRWLLGASFQVLTGGDDKSARIWKASRQDSSCWEQVVVLRGNHSDSVRAVAWRPDEGQRQHRVVIAVGLADSTIVLWQSSTPPHDRRCFEASTSPSESAAAGLCDSLGAHGRREVGSEAVGEAIGAASGLWTGHWMVLSWPVAVGRLKNSG